MKMLSASPDVVGTYKGETETNLKRINIMSPQKAT